jgi:Leucine-rich repeat (LRR) protein
MTTLAGILSSFKRIFRNKTREVGVFPDDGEDPVATELKTGQVEITVSPDKKNRVSFRAAARAISVDWGDGVVEASTPNGESRLLEHVYPDRTPRRIKVSTKGLVRVGELAREGKTWKGAFHALRFGNCLELECIYCEEAGLTRLEIKRAGALKWLFCASNHLTALDASTCPALTSLSCDYNQLATLDVSGCTALTTLSCFCNRLTVLDVSRCTALTGLSCSFNHLATLDVRRCTALTSLSCSFNHLAALDVRRCTVLTSLSCYSNQLETLNVSKCPALTSLSCDKNQLRMLEVSKCMKLSTLACSFNQLTALDVSPCTGLSGLDCSGNRLEAPALNVLFTDLPERPGNGVVQCSDNPGYNSPWSMYNCNKGIATRKGWKVQ